MIQRDRVPIGTRSHTVRTWLPGEPPHGILVLTDGQNAFARRRSERATWEADRIAADLIARDLIRPIAIVAIHAAPGMRRWEEYLPYPDPYNAKARRFEADRFVDVVIPAILRATRRRYPDVGRADRVVIGGSSYGAVAALHAAVRHPREFEGLLIESAPLWVGDGALIDDARRSRIRARTWIGVGTRETRAREKSEELVRLARRLAAALRPAAPVRLRVAAGAPHHETAWASRLPDALRWLFS